MLNGTPRKRSQDRWNMRSESRSPAVKNWNIAWHGGKAIAHAEAHRLAEDRARPDPGAVLTVVALGQRLAKDVEVLPHVEGDCARCGGWGESQRLPRSSPRP